MLDHTLAQVAKMDLIGQAVTRAIHLQQEERVPHALRRRLNHATAGLAAAE